MDRREDSDVVAFSLVRGGPFYLLLRAAHLARDDGRDPARESLALAALAWFPLAAVGLAQRLAVHQWNELMLDPSVHVRSLVSVPLMLLAEQAMHALSKRCIDRFVESDLVSGGAAALRPVLARATRFRDAAFPEIVLAVAAFGGGQAVLWGLMGLPASAHVKGTIPAPFAARAWWATVALPIAQFLLYRSAWRWAIWSFVLWRLAGLDVRPVAVHPDRRGGLAFLGEPAMAFALVAASVSCVVASAWGGQMVFERPSLESFALPLSGLVAGSFVVTLGPLGVFSRCMWQARFAAVRQYDRFALAYARLFQDKWVDADGAEDVLGTPDIQSMADLANTLTIVRGMRLFPFGAIEASAVLVAVLAPMVPLLLATLPAAVLLRHLGGILLGGLPR